VSFYDELPTVEEDPQGASPDAPGLEGCVPPPLPPLPGDLVLGGEEVPEEQRRLWDMLQHEGFRQRAEGFRSDWAFHRVADDEDLGLPLARGARVVSDGKEYAYQVFARDTLFNEVPRWGEVQRLSQLAGGQMPSGGLALDILRASYAALGQELKPDWLSHQVALRERLGPALGPAYRATLDGQEYSLQVFACDVVYFVPGQWQQALRLSATPEGPLREALRAEAAKAAGAPLDQASPLAQAAGVEVGVPLSPAYEADLDGSAYRVQVFAMDTVYAPASGGEARRQSALRTLRGPLPEPAAASTSTSSAAQPGGSGPADALSDRRPTFAMLPLPGKPRISQFYGYTRFSASGGRQFYTATQGMHSGIDFAVPDGTDLLAINYGVVLCAGHGCPFGASKPQSILVRYGSVYALYGHASAVHVSAGQPVSPGEVIGKSGTFSGPHLHFELRPVPKAMLANTNPAQAPQNPGFALNPIAFFSADLQPYFEHTLAGIGGRGEHFCIGDLHSQPQIVFGQGVVTTPCS
jgi:murein DD-endopeptidase MepM/ murein hydrolase activator NlpD